MMLDRINALLLSLLLAIAPLASARASQNALLSPTTGTVSGLQLTNNYNAALDSLNTANSGGTAPTNQLSGSASLGNWWLNTTLAPFPYGMNDGTSNWPSIGAIDPTAHAWNLQIGGGSATLASASTVDLCSTPRNDLTISGTTTINSFGSSCPAGVIKLVTFSGLTTLTYNSGSMIIPGAASVLTSVGDQALAVSLGSGNWKLATYTPANGSALVNPSVDVGTYQLTSAVNLPSSKYLLAYGQPISRTTYATYLAASTITQSVTRTNGSPTLTGFSDTTQIPNTAPIEGGGIPAGAYITSCTSTTCAMSVNATSSGTANATVFPNGNGDGSTTFNLPNCAGSLLAGRNNMGGTPTPRLTSTYFGTNPNALGAFGGSQSQTLAASQLPSNIPYTDPGHTHGVAGDPNSIMGISSASGGQDFGSGSKAQRLVTSAIVIGNGITGITINPSGGNPHPIVPPTTTVNCMVRVLAMLDLPSSPNSLAANDNDLSLITDRRRA